MIFVIEFKFSKIIQISKNSIYFLLILLLLVRIVLCNLRSNWPNKEEKKKKKRKEIIGNELSRYINITQLNGLIKILTICAIHCCSIFSRII